MQNLIRLVEDLKKKPGTTDQQVFNLIREYLQVLILKALYQSRYGKGLSFIGGTCLRICYNLKRFSEHLDFTLDRKIPNYSFQELNEIIARYLKGTDFEVDLNIKSEKVVQKSFIRIHNILHFFALSQRQEQKIHVKLEVDIKPIVVSDHDIETYFVTKLDELFPILKHRNETLFAGKILAILNRTYTKGRDYYDLIWYLNKKIDIDLNYLNRGLKQAGLELQFHNKNEVIEHLQKQIARVSTDTILKDIGSFLEDASEERWVRDYSSVFKQSAKDFLEK
ncbi:MAG: nucleotidyl transferase AbiEii/AbiGii toxin family protein [Deltaproteobacteria bacterium]|nr:nucleotidyl transferase AbiEii/AbiGii toxin family protein [Deltaproteobacteria bacterium]